MAYTTYQLGEMVAQAAARYGLNPRIAVEQIRQESGFNPNATSPQGAQGLAQFMPGTWARWGVGSPYDPVAAIEAYARHMRYLLDRFGGDYRLALAGYHSGEGAARAALNNPAGNPRTVNYVNTILARAGSAAQSGSAAGANNNTQSWLPDLTNFNIPSEAAVALVVIVLLGLMRRI